MHSRRLTVPLRSGLVVGLVLLGGLAGCRTSPSVAAYVDEEQITVDELAAAVEQRLADPALAEAVGGQEDQFTRRVLEFLLTEEVYEEVAARYDVQVADAAVRARIDELLAGGDAEATYAELAARGVSRGDVFENVRQQLVRQEVAAAAGLGQADEAALRQSYEQARASDGERPLGLITVPDQATADALVAQLTADPAAYPQLAAQHPGPATLPALSPIAPGQLPAALAQAVVAAPPGTAFAQPVPEAGGVVVTYVPTFEQARPQLEEEARGAAEDAAGELVQEVRAELDITVNPRFGVIEDGSLVPAEGEVVDILEEEAGTGPAGGAAAAGD